MLCVFYVWEIYETGAIIFRFYENDKILKIMDINTSCLDIQL